MTRDQHALRALRAVDALGYFFALQVGATPDAPPPNGLRPLRELYATGRDGSGPDAPLAARIRLVGERLRTPEARVAASSVQFGIAARLLSVALGAVAFGGVLPDLDPDRAYARQPADGPLDLWVPYPQGAPARPVTAEQVHREVLLANLAPLGTAVRAITPVAERLLWGNAASALVGTLRVLRGQPGAAHATVAAVARQLLAREPLAGSSTWSPAFRRTTCCLYYRVPGGGLCGDCVFTTAPGAATGARR